ncbi:MAG: aminoglycoside phosphotransferase family protein [Gemmatimonadota bacterium]|nr:aminoglycoside phosphotransferase family protein [Gemmatimonadota bacterium]
MTALAHALLAPDEALPARDQLLDTDVARSLVGLHLGRPGGPPITGCRRIKAKYRIGESLRVLFRVEVAGGSHFVAARMFPGGRAHTVYREALCHAVDGGPLLPIGCDETSGTVFWTFPNDRRIRHLAALLQPRADFDAALAGRWAETRVVAYAPERAATAQCLAADGAVLGYAKVYAGDDGARSRELHDRLVRAVGSAAELQLPRALAYAESERLLVVEPLAGDPVGAFEPSRRIEGYRKLGAALARLHSAPVQLDEQFRRLEPTRLQQASRLVGWARPELAAISARLSRELTTRFRPGHDPQVCLHGDVNSRNWLLQEDRVALIDLDQVAMGPAAADLGGAIAGLLYREITHEWSGTEAGALRQALCAGYDAIRPLPSSDALRWHTAAALLAERALRAVTRFRVDGLMHLAGLLTAALDQLEVPTHV